MLLESKYHLNHLYVVPAQEFIECVRCSINICLTKIEYN